MYLEARSNPGAKDAMKNSGKGPGKKGKSPKQEIPVLKRGWHRGGLLDYKINEKVPVSEREALSQPEVGRKESPETNGIAENSAPRGPLYFTVQEVYLIKIVKRKNTTTGGSWWWGGGGGTPPFGVLKRQF